MPHTRTWLTAAALAAALLVLVGVFAVYTAHFARPSAAERQLDDLDRQAEALREEFARKAAGKKYVGREARDLFTRLVGNREAAVILLESNPGIPDRARRHAEAVRQFRDLRDQSLWLRGEPPEPVGFP